MILSIAITLALLATLLLLRHVALRYRAFPKRAPMGLRFDGRPQTEAPKLFIWLAPAVLAVLVVLVTVLTRLQPPAEEQELLMTLVYVTLFEIALLLMWTVDRQLELARKMTYRVAPARLWRALAPLLLTLAVLLFLALRPS